MDLSPTQWRKDPEIYAKIGVLERIRDLNNSKYYIE
jgi:hypothetical protein